MFEVTLQKLESSASPRLTLLSILQHLVVLPFVRTWRQSEHGNGHNMATGRTWRQPSTRLSHSHSNLDADGNPASRQFSVSWWPYHVDITVGGVLQSFFGYKCDCRGKTVSVSLITDSFIERPCTAWPAAHGGSVGRGTALRAGGSVVRFSVGHWLNLSCHNMVSNWNECQVYFLWVNTVGAWGWQR